MGVLKSNPLLWAAIALVAFYWMASPFIPNPYLSSLFSLLLIISAALTFMQYAWQAVKILVYKDRSRDEYGRGKGSHLAILGIFLFSFGSVFSGFYGLWWNFNGQPIEWIGSAASQFGRGCHVLGFCLMQVSPEITKEGFAFKARWWIIATGSAILIAIGFYFGMQVKTIETTDALKAWRMQNIDRPPCPVDRSIWGSRSRLYHTEQSPYRLLLVPSHCFANEREAIEAGFRPPMRN